MKAVLLAAGRGSRLGERTRELPKCLAPLAGKPLLSWQLEALRGAGLGEIAVVRGYKAEVVAAPGLTYFENPRWAETNMVASLACAEAWLLSGPCLVSYTDIVYDSAAASALAAASAEIAVLYDPGWRALWEARFACPLEDAETFRHDERGRLIEIGARPSSFDQVQGQYMGLLRFSPEGWRRAREYWQSLPPERHDRLDMTSLLSALLGRGVHIETIPYAGRWGEVDRPEDLALYERWLTEDPRYFSKIGRVNEAEKLR